MRLNPLPFLFAPGAAAAGYLVSGAAGAVTGLAAWSAVVGVATCISFWVRRRGGRHPDA